MDTAVMVWLQGVFPQEVKNWFMHNWYAYRVMDALAKFGERSRRVRPCLQAGRVTLLLGLP